MSIEKYNWLAIIIGIGEDKKTDVCPHPMCMQ